MLLRANEVYTEEQIKGWLSSGYTFERLADGFRLTGWNGRSLDELRHGYPAASQEPEVEPEETVDELISRLVAMRDAGMGSYLVITGERLYGDPVEASTIGQTVYLSI